MKLGLPILFEFDSLEENFALAKELGLDFVELNLNFRYCRDALEQRDLPALLERYGLEATLHFYDEADFGSYAPVVEGYLSLLKHYLRFGKGAIKQVNVHLNAGPVVTIAGEKRYLYEKEYDSYIETLVNNLNEAQCVCGDYEANLVIENVDLMPPFMKRVYPRLKEEGFRFCFDIGHDHLSQDLLWNLQKECSLPFDEFHIHDAKERKKCHLALGEGELNILPFKRLAEENDAYVVLEVKQGSDLRISVPAFRALS